MHDNAAGPENFTLDKFIALSDGPVVLKPSKTPLLIIKYGPPGSGKTSADNQVEKMFSVDLDNYAKVDKDTPLTSIKSFRDGSIKIIKHHDGLHYHHRAQHRVQKLQNKTLKAKNKDGLSINEKVPIILQHANGLAKEPPPIWLSSRPTIDPFLTTGSSKPHANPANTL